MKTKHTKEKVFSTIEDKKIKKDPANSPVWNNCIHYKDATKEDKAEGGYVYTVYFEGTVPVNVTTVTKVGAHG